MTHTQTPFENLILLGISKLYQLSERNSFVSKNPTDMLTITLICCFLLLLFYIYYIKVLSESLGFTPSYIGDRLTVQRLESQGPNRNKLTHPMKYSTKSPFIKCSSKYGQGTQKQKQRDMQYSLGLAKGDILTLGLR